MLNEQIEGTPQEFKTSGSTGLPCVRFSLALAIQCLTEGWK